MTTLDGSLFRQDRASPPPRVGAGIHPPIGIELRYRRDIIAITNETDRQIREAVHSHVAGWVEEVSAAAGIRRDAWADALDAVFSNIVSSMVRRLATEGPAAVRRASLETNDTNLRQWRRTIRSAYQVDVFKAEPWLPQQLAAWEAQNLSLITEMQTARITRLKGVVTQAVGSATRSTEIEAQVREALGVGRGRAKLIARDQIAKLNGNLTQVRQEASGVDEYIWSTSLDERVRPSHRSKEGKRFRWDSPPSDTGHPGHDYQCRCVALPILPMVEEILRGAGE